MHLQQAGLGRTFIPLVQVQPLLKTLPSGCQRARHFAPAVCAAWRKVEGS